MKAAELRDLEAAMADPDRADEMDAIIERYGEAQARFEELDLQLADAQQRHSELDDAVIAAQRQLDAAREQLSGS